MRLMLCSVMFAAGCLLSLAARSSDLDHATDLVAAGDYAAAYELLAPLEFELSGSESFDLLFAFSALEVGETGVAMLALERVLAVNPESETARFLLARAYFILHDYDGARREFELLLSLNPTRGLGESVGQYLDAIASRQPATGTHLSGYVALGIGHDTNVTGGTANDLIYLPGLDLDFTPAASESEDADDYSNLGAGFDVVHRFNTRQTIYLGNELNLRAHHDRNDLDYLLNTLRAGYQHVFGNQSVRVGLNTGYWRLHGDPYQDSDALELEWRSTFAPRTQLAIFGRQTAYRYRAGLDAALNYDDTRLRLSLSRLFGQRGDKLISVAFDVGREDDINHRNDGNNDYIGLRLTGQMAVTDRANGFLIISSQKDDFDRDNPLFSKRRSESQYQIAAGVILSFRENTSLRATVVLVDTDSNISLYDSSSSDFSLIFRRDFL